MEKLVEQLRTSTSQNEQSEWRRKCWRMKFEAPGMAALECSSITDDPIYLTTHDINPDGLGFLCHHKLTIGQKLIINIETENGEIEIPATVMHCTTTVGMFKVGVHFDLLDPKNN